jgi:hypothetical protein
MTFGGRGTMRRWVLLLAVATGGGCAHQMGKNATAGAIAGFQSQREATLAATGETPGEMLGSSITKGVIGQLQDPQQAQVLQGLAAEIARAAVTQALVSATKKQADGSPSLVEMAVAQGAGAVEHELVRALAVDLGRQDPGSVGGAVSAAAERISASATRGVVDNLLPRCDAHDPRCLDRRVSDLGASAGAGVMKGVLAAFPTLLAAGVFLLGVLFTLLVLVAWRLLTWSGGTRAERRRAHDRRVPQEQP